MTVNGRRMRTRLLTSALAGMTLAAVVVFMAAPAEVWAAASSVKVLGSATTVRPDLPTPTDGAVSPPTPYRLTAAKNEFESFQVIVEAGDQPISGLRVDPNAQLDQVDANGNEIPGGASISNVTVYREHNYNVATPSDGEGATGLWPDALIPENDFFYNENRNAFPIDVAANKKVVVWVDVLVPRTVAAGKYAGSLAVSATSGLPQTTVPIDLEVLNFALQSTSPLQNAFLTSYGDECLAHTGNRLCNGDLEQRWRLHSLYARAALENRLTISNPVPLGTNEGPPTGQNLTHFNQYITPLLKDGVQNSIRLPGAKLTSFSVYTYNQNDHCQPACVDQWEAFASSNGFADRMFLYSCDEPGVNATRWAGCRTALTDQTGPPKLVTSTIDDATDSGYLPNIDLLTPVVNRMDDKAAPYKGDQRSKYDAFLAADTRNRLWMYTSNMSFGSDGPPDAGWNSPYWNGWPGYAIDQPATQSRAMGWLLFEYGATGELYWQTTQKLATAWTDQYEQGGNGDGTLFYPGTPTTNLGGGTQLGGTRDIPIESIRLKRIRDGREDYEYLKYLADHGKGTEAENVARSLFPVMYDATATQTELDNARNRLIDLIEQINPPASDCRTATTSSPGVTSANGTITGTPGDDVIVGTADDDTINGLAGNDSICGGAGYDSISGGPNDDTLDGGDGLDALYYRSAAAGVSVDLAAGTATGEGTDTLSSFTEVYGSDSADTIKGDGNVNYLNGYSGNDEITGGPGNDWMLGGAGDDTVNSHDGVADIGGNWNPAYGVECGPGTDRFTADAQGDTINPDCEESSAGDTVAPTIAGMRPANGSTIRDRTPTISAHVRDVPELTKNGIALKVDGNTIAQRRWSYDAFAERLGYTTGRLSYGRHTVRITATDEAGNVGSRGWRFSVRR